jgi:hypothetical protein
VAKTGDSVSGFEIGLSVEVFGLDVADVFFFARRADEEV